MNECLKYVSADIKKIYSRIEDDISRQIFESRLLMTFLDNNGNSCEIGSLRKKRDNDKRLMELFRKIKGLDGDILIYGAGECGKYICDSHFMKDVPVQGFIDNKEWNKKCVHNLPVYRFEDAVKQFKKANIILSMESYASRLQVKGQIAKRGVDWNITDAGTILQEIDKETLLGTHNFYDEYLYDLINTNNLVSELLDRIRNAMRPSAYWLVLGQGDNIGKLMKEKWGNYPWSCYITADKRQDEYNGIPVYSYEEAVDKYEQLDVVIEPEGENDIISEKISSFKAMGECINLHDITEMLSKNQYFDFFAYSGIRETFVDGGVFDLSSTEMFIKWCRGNYEKVFAFEPEKRNYESCKKKIGNRNNISLFSCGLYDKQGKIGFTSGLGGASRIENPKQDFYADYDIEVQDLDSVIKDEKITFIKMDIEGAEEKALLGAKRIITAQKPKLAICVYHKPEDILELPALILKMRPDYKIAFRHYSLRDTETVMYAW
ncbi:MAG: FkbM family methyltransferase [Ruminococcus sp.]|nr:FkbM family methyltransferase [Ruminococcus sp.]